MQSKLLQRNRAVRSLIVIKYNDNFMDHCKYCDSRISFSSQSRWPPSRVWVCHCRFILALEGSGSFSFDCEKHFETPVDMIQRFINKSRIDWLPSVLTNLTGKKIGYRHYYLFYFAGFEQNEQMLNLATAFMPVMKRVATGFTLGECVRRSESLKQQDFHLQRGWS